ncbi:helix-turn-helix domain-containing protein [Paraburkholderia sp. LEh10]|jgi:transposase|uniref:helix-turn-helix domain-containing protein n=1 Tax=Paraburkholderia sp. LEh10 TaxID=2821353 RepID=UPI001AE71F68|nr:helix-turn-helix domain-containing protein [Paraburkholderia sp. LEh10]MBP0589637.1 helix-turn-helix domain-containing protein [Paraburkholderia sp. LEh10]
MASRNEELPTVMRRLAAGKMLMEGASISDVAAQLHISENTVRKYRTLVNEGGLDSLRRLSVGGRSSVLDEAALRWIADALSGPAGVHGFPSDAWTSNRLRELIRARFGVSYSRVYTWQIATNLGLGHRLTKSRK